ncbi:MAG: 6-carboxytetrahydropterin synthase QueD [Acidobacteriaceae bacterium]|nr:6-carboxytetrahydropterin synthase QueD [Acidobacteriaceae bacterium]MBV8571102.1 6-carboxytetrahydropterin synthase QueD [Acidobacteriaceae bacterium]
MFEICVEHTFAAAHALRNYRGKCENVHGHNYRVQVGMQAEELDENGLLYDFAELKHRLRETSAYLDHHFVNELKPFDTINPSAENIAKFIFDEIQRSLDRGGSLAYVRVWETDTSCAVYRP